MSARRHETETQKIKNFYDYFILKVIKFISIIGREMRGY
jgi:hypothetical protein